MRIAVFSLVFLAGCASGPLPEQRAPTGAQNSEYLDFLPADQLAALVQTGAASASEDLLERRLADLRGRATRIRGPVFTSKDRARLTGAPP